MASRQAVLGMERASFFYGSARVFSGVSFLLDGARTALVGENGAGKSTLLKCLVGELELNGGQDLPWKSPDQIRVEMTRYVNEGADFVKYGATGDGKPFNSEIGQEAVLRFSPEQQRAMVEAVHAAGKIIQTHQPSAEGLQVVVTAGDFSDVEYRIELSSK